MWSALRIRQVNQTVKNCLQDWNNSGGAVEQCLNYHKNFLRQRIALTKSMIADVAESRLNKI